MELLLQDSFLLLSLYIVSGMIFGSFATALVYRLPREIDWVKQRSQCTSCNTNLGVLDLIPIFSYIINLGKCRHCKVYYGFRYLYIEILMAASFGILGWYYDYSTISIFLCFLAFAVIILSVIDFEHYIIPDEVNLFILLLGIGYQLHLGPTIEQMLYMPLLYLVIALILRWSIYLWKKREGLGMGDVKFFLAAGMWLDVEKLPVFLMISGIAGIIIALTWSVLGKGKLFPFGPALSASLFFCVAFPTLSAELLYKFHDLIY